MASVTFYSHGKGKDKIVIGSFRGEWLAITRNETIRSGFTDPQSVIDSLIAGNEQYPAISSLPPVLADWKTTR